MFLPLAVFGRCCVSLEVVENWARGRLFMRWVLWKKKVGHKIFFQSQVCVKERVMCCYEKILAVLSLSTRDHF